MYDWRTALYLLTILSSAGCAGLQGRDYQREGVRLVYGLISDVVRNQNPREVPRRDKVAATGPLPLPGFHRQREAGQPTVVASAQAQFGPDRVFAAD